MIDLQAYRGIVFDMDGTLLDSMGAHLNAWQQTCEQFGLPFDRPFMYSLGGVPTTETVRLLSEHYQQPLDVPAVARFKEAAYQARDHAPTLIASTLAVFEHYRPSHAIGVGTGAGRHYASQLLAHHGLLERLDTLVTASDVLQGKPHPETFLTVASQMQVAPHQCVVFEDTEIGVQAAGRAGMDCFLVSAGEIQPDVIKAPGN